MSKTSSQQQTLSVASPGVNKVKSDLVILTYMAHQLSLILQQQDITMSSTKPWLSSLQDSHKHAYHIALYQPHELLISQCLSFVGFVGGKQQPGNSFIQNEIERIDELMITELVNISSICSYSSLEVRSGCWYNMAIFHNAETKVHLKSNHIHNYAAYQLAPQYYEWIRLHHGIMPGGLQPQELLLQSTKYYTFHESQKIQKCT